MIANRLAHQGDFLLDRHLVSDAEDSYRAALKEDAKCFAALAWKLARDSTYSDAILQKAFIDLHEKNYVEAVPLALRQVLATPALRDAHVGLYKVGREAIGMHDGSTPSAGLSFPRSTLTVLSLRELFFPDMNSLA